MEFGSVPSNSALSLPHCLRPLFLWYLSIYQHQLYNFRIFLYICLHLRVVSFFILPFDHVHLYPSIHHESSNRSSKSNKINAYIDKSYDYNLDFFQLDLCIWGTPYTEQFKSMYFHCLEPFCSNFEALHSGGVNDMDYHKRYKLQNGIDTILAWLWGLWLRTGVHT